MITEHDIQNAVRELRLSSLPVCLHSSFKSFGGVEGGPESVVRAFLVEHCTVIVPAFSDDFGVNPPPDIRPERNGWDYGDIPHNQKGVDRVYSADTNEITQCEMGVIPATVLTQAGRVRGNHPLCSFVAVGPEAGPMILGQTPIDIFAPLWALAEAGGWVVLMGVGLHSMTLLHAAEELAGRRPFVRWANGTNGKPVGVTMGGCSDGFGRFESILSPLARSTQVGQSLWLAYPAMQALKAASAAIHDIPEITRCTNSKCGRCGDQVQGGPIDFEELANKALQRTRTSRAAEL